MHKILKVQLLIHKCYVNKDFNNWRTKAIQKDFTSKKNWKWSLNFHFAMKIFIWQLKQDLTEIIGEPGKDFTQQEVEMTKLQQILDLCSR